MALDAEKARSEQKRRAQQAAERKARKDSRGRRSRAKGDQPKILLDARQERAEATGGANARLREDRGAAVEARLSEAREKIEVVKTLIMEVAPNGLPRSRTVLRMNGITGGTDPARPILRNFSLTITGPERVAITGASPRADVKSIRATERHDIRLRRDRGHHTLAQRGFR